MGGVAADTHAIIWYLREQHQLSASALAALDQAELGGQGIYVSAISLVEARYLMDLPLVSRDRKIRASQIETIW